MTHYWKRAARILFHNFGWKLLAVATAFLIWALVATEPELSTWDTVRIEYKNVPDDLEVMPLEPASSAEAGIRCNWNCAGRPANWAGWVKGAECVRRWRSICRARAPANGHSRLEAAT